MRKLFRLAVVVAIIGLIYYGLSTPTMKQLEDYYRTERADSPQTPKVLNFIARICELTGRSKLAAQMYEKNLAQFPYHSAARYAQYRVGFCYAKERRFQKAISAFTTFAIDYKGDIRNRKALQMIERLKHQILDTPDEATDFSQ